MSVMGPTVWAAPTGKDQGLSYSATVSGRGATALHGWCWWLGKGCHQPPAHATAGWTLAGSRWACGLHPGTGGGAGMELQQGWLMPLAYDFWGWPGGWRLARSETLRFTLVAVPGGSTLSEGLERDFFRPSSSLPAASKRVDSNAARSSEPAFSLARSSMA